MGTGIVVFDVDAPLSHDDLLQLYPWVEGHLMVPGNTKGWHVYGRSTEYITTQTKCLSAIEGDVIASTIVMEKTGKEWSGTLQDFPSLDDHILPWRLDALKQLKTATSPVARVASTGTVLEAIVNLIAIPHLEDRTSWIKIVLASKKCGLTEDYVRIISAKASSYEASGFDSVWNSYDLKDLTAGEGTLRHYAKLSNLEAYEALKRPHADDPCLVVPKLIAMKQAFTIKITLPDNYDELSKAAQKAFTEKGKSNREDEYAKWYYATITEMTKYFEKYHFKIMTPPTFGRIAYNQTIIQTTKEIETQYENVLILKPNAILPCSFVSVWRSLPTIRTYEKVDFAPHPLPCPAHVFNMFNGLVGARLPAAASCDTEWFDKHLSILTGHEDISYMLNYCAHMLQKPGELPRVAIIFKSDQGCGKNVFWESFIKCLLGREYLLQTAEIDKILGRFSMSNNKLCIIMDETSGKDSFLNSEKIKNNITAETMAWERKGIDGIVLNNCARYLFFTNNSTPIKVELTDRRFVAYECANDVRNNEAYFADMIAKFKDPAQMKSLYDRLMSRDISTWNSVASRPKTAFYKDIQSASIPPLARFLDELCMNHVDASLEVQLALENVRSNDLFKEFTAWLRENGFLKVDYNTTKFGREIARVPGIEKKKTMVCAMIRIDFDQLRIYLTGLGL